jgi:hypothetical protein
MRGLGKHDANAYILQFDVSEIFDTHDRVWVAANECDDLLIIRGSPK